MGGSAEGWPLAVRLSAHVLITPLHSLSLALADGWNELHVNQSRWVTIPVWEVRRLSRRDGYAAAVDFARLVRKISLRLLSRLWRAAGFTLLSLFLSVQREALMTHVPPGVDIRGNVQLP